ncbi:GH39 family glycosyl hydrolase [Natronobacillus azotifigens]|uniref:Helix-turn-helix domain-containing protein n=1 Tax=Natronobacillus azotifigens TaxID=472978 RepID=A0A9J6RAE0_9BACI|nr:helix-turn-helix domain-containing protein [Natronobacillus azotifigens]
MKRHWHQTLELILNIRGDVKIVVNEEAFHLKSGDIILINSNEIHELYSDDAVMIALQIKPELLKDIVIDTKKLYFDCNSVRSNKPDRFRSIKRVIAQIIKYNMDTNELIDLKNASLVYELIFELCVNFLSDKKDAQQYTEETLDRLSGILGYINSNYNEQITLNELAEKEFLSVPYLSKFFKQSMGISYSDYIKQVRLHHAVIDLYNDTLTIDNVASKNGFPNTRSFVTAFREKYNELPSTWRKKNVGKALGSIEATKESSVNYLHNEPLSYYKDIANFIEQYAELESTIALADDKTPKYSTNISADVSKFKRKLYHSFKTFTGVSRAKEILTVPVQEALKLVQKEIGFTYIKMHSILDDDMMVYNETSSGSPIYNFRLIENVFDFLLSINLKPLVQFSFMPKKLASNSEKTVFYTEINTSPPIDMDKWKQLIHALTNHLIKRYGRKEVRSWLFCVWNEPSTSNHLFGFEKNEIFYNLYKNTYQVIKEIDSSLSFGGPAAFSTYGKSEDWFFRFLDFSITNQCKPDFITIHYYDIDLSTVKDSTMDNLYFPQIENKELCLSPTKNSFTQFIDRVKKGLQKIGFDDEKVYLTEWNSTVSHRDLMNDTCFKASYIIKNITENYDRLDSFGYWLLTDYHEEYLMNKSLFHGGLGMLAYDNIKKPSYHAFFLLNKLGDVLVESGDGYMITKREDDYQIILHNYQHYNDTYAKGIAINISYNNRYSNFTNNSKREFYIELSNIEGTYEIRHTLVNRTHGSAFDNEVRLGKTEGYHTIDELNYLKGISVPKIKIEYADSSSKSITIQTILEPHEIRLIELSKLSE